jgi:hypothetical protein
MKSAWILFLIALLVSAIILPIVYIHNTSEKEALNEDFFFGVTYGLNTTSEAKLLIDKVKGYTNLFIINSWDITTNETALNEICEYAVNADMNIMVFFDFIGIANYPYAWHQTWLDSARDKWGDRFLGVYLYDEPGGRQIDEGQWDQGEEVKKIFENVSDYSDAANRFVTSIHSSGSMQDTKNRSIPVFTSDYALYWFDYLAGYDDAFVELGWNHSTTQNIALGRGAANVQGKDWGAIITWTYQYPPYLASGPQILQDMLIAYQSGAKYIVLFNYPQYPESNPYGILAEEHFTAMETFWNQIHASPRSASENTVDQVAFVLPKDYGWGMRNQDDKIWGFWGPDDLSPLIWDNMNKLITRYGLKLDIIYDDPQFNFKEKYSRIYFWNSTIN